MSESLSADDSSLKAPGIVLEDEGLVLKPSLLPFEREKGKPAAMACSLKCWGSGLTVEAELLFQGSVLPEEARLFCMELAEDEEMVDGGRIPDILSNADGAA